MTDKDRFLSTVPAAPSAQNLSGTAEPANAGALLRAARHQQGLHIAALAAAMKVPVARLEALEAGRYQELVDTTFARALAQAMCRALRIDPVPVLALMPGSSPDALGRVDGGLNTPFREHGGRGLPADWAPWQRPALWLVALLLLAAAAFVLVPAGALLDPPLPAAGAPLMPPDGSASAPMGSLAAPPSDPATGPLQAGADPATALASSPLPSLVPVATAVSGNPGAAAVAQGLPATPPMPPMSPMPQIPPMPAQAAAAASAVGAAATVQVRALKDSWVQAVDANKQTLLARNVQAGETVALSPVMPLRLRIGNVAGTEVLLRGQPVDLGAGKRDNILNLTLQ